MKGNTIECGPVWGASGVQGFFGEGYWYHKWLYLVGMWFVGIVFTAKTTTFHPREGNMPRRADGITPKEWFPKCVVVKFWKRVVLNAVGLSGPGFEALLSDGRWQKRTKPFFLSFMSVAPTFEERRDETLIFVRTLKSRLSEFKGSVRLQINVSCPNVKGSDNIVKEARMMLDIAQELGIQLYVKIALTTSPEDAEKISLHPACTGLVITNTIPFGDLPEEIDWKGIFGSKTSPLIQRGFVQKGGLSGKPLLPLLVKWIQQARALGIEKHINAGGGILSPIDVVRLWRAGADSISIATIVILAPWMVIPTTLTAHILFGLFRRKRKGDSSAS